MSKGIFTATNVPDGVYILTKNKNFIQPPFWELYADKETPASVALVHSDRSLLITLTDLTENKINILPFDSVQTGKEHETIDSALQDFDGLENTKRLSDSGSIVATEVLRHNLLGYPCHIPTLGEWKRICVEKLLLNDAINILEESTLKDDCFLTSTRKSKLINYFFDLDIGIVCGNIQNNEGFIRCVSDVSLSII